jgi:hypothetical protein
MIIRPLTRTVSVCVSLLILFLRRLMTCAGVNNEYRLSPSAFVESYLSTASLARNPRHLKAEDVCRSGSEAAGKDSEVGS